MRERSSKRYKMANGSTFNQATVQSGTSDTEESWGLREVTNTVEKIKKSSNRVIMDLSGLRVT